VTDVVLGHLRNRGSAGFGVGGIGIDVFSRLIVVGWRAFSSMSGELTLDALEQALWAQDRSGEQIHHSDPGSQHLATRFCKRLAEEGIDPYMGSVGDSYDNAIAASIIGLFKTEVNRSGCPWRSIESVEYANHVGGLVQQPAIARTGNRQRLRDHGNWTGYGGKLDLAKPTRVPNPRYTRPDGLRREDFAFGFCSPSPWFYQANFIGSHDPYWPPPEYAERYRDAPVPGAIPVDLDGKPAWVGRRFITDDSASIAFVRRQYSACIESIDAWVGRMLDVLEEGAMLDNTVVIFTSDHGDMLGDFGLFTKRVAYEASVRVPLIVSGEGVPAGSTSDALVEWFDLNPTICELADLPPQESINARSLAPILRGTGTTHREHVLSALYNFRAVRSRRWKYVRDVNDTAELYDLESDPLKRENLIGRDGEPAARARELSQVLEMRWRQGMWRR
jgi:transposase InsO family protein